MYRTRKRGAPPGSHTLQQRRRRASRVAAAADFALTWAYVHVPRPGLRAGCTCVCTQQPASRTRNPRPRRPLPLHTRTHPHNRAHACAAPATHPPTPATHHVRVVRHDSHAADALAVQLHVCGHLARAHVPAAQLAARAARQQERAAAGSSRVRVEAGRARGRVGTGQPRRAPMLMALGRWWHRMPLITRGARARVRYAAGLTAAQNGAHATSRSGPSLCSSSSGRNTPHPGFAASSLGVH